MPQSHLTDAFFQCPDLFYGRFASEGVACLDERVWVTSYALCREALADQRLRSGLGADSHASDANLLFLDGPAHTRLRRAVTAAIAAGPPRPAFERSVIKAWDYCAGQLAMPSTVDFLTAVAQPVAAHVIAELLGFEPDEADALVPSLRAVTAAFEEFEPAAERRAGAAASRELLSTVDERFDVLERRSGFVASLGRAAAAGEISDFEAVSTTVVFLSAGFENSANFLAGVALDLLTGVAAAGTNLEELFRRVSPAHVAVRAAAEPMRIGRVEVAAGTTLHLVLGAANADPAVFGPGPGGPPHLAFGHGPHACVGAGLARVEMGVLVERIARLLAGAALLEAPIWRPRLEFRTLASLPVSLAGAGDT